MYFNSNFSREAFGALGTNSPESERLSKTLQEIIADDLRQEIAELGNRLATTLNGLGHQLTKIDSESDQGRVSVTFADISDGAERHCHLLRFDLDLIVSVGYPGYAEK